MTDDQFRIIRGFLLTLVILVGFIAGILLALAWEYESFSQCLYRPRRDH